MAKALEILGEMNLPEDHAAQLHLRTVSNVLELGMLYSASGNSIPGLGGKGLQELLILAEDIIANGYALHSSKLNFKNLALGFKVG